MNIEYGYVESAHLRNLKVVLANFMGNTEDLVATSDLEMELPKVLEIVEILKKSKFTPQSVKEAQLSSQSNDQAKSGGALGILEKYEDVIRDYCRVE